LLVRPTSCRIVSRYLEVDCIFTYQFVHGKHHQKQYLQRVLTTIEVACRNLL
jgi:hypothetical protein